MVQRGAERGELRSGIDADLLVDTLVGPLYHRVLVTGDSIDRPVTDEIVDLVLVGASP
jgi:hypothetical protein